jgi:sugar phosphate isomerase/epimerase
MLVSGLRLAMHLDDISRREFVAAGAVAIAGAALPLAAADAPREANKLIAFTKPFRNLNAARTAELVAEVGWAGVELPVRNKDGQILPAKVDDELPAFVEAFKAKGCEASIVTTEILEVNASAEKVLRAAARLGIKRYRLGSLQYVKDKPIAQQLAEFGARLRDLAALNKELGIQGGYQNHSGPNYVGAPIWDVWTLLRELDPKAIGFCYDIGHATVEGGQSWPTTFRAVQPWLTAVFVKDFAWSKNDRGWRPAWCPLGEGMVAPSFFQMLKAAKYDGPICQHHEYELGADPITHYKRDLSKLREMIAR